MSYENENLVRASWKNPDALEAIEKQMRRAALNIPGDAIVNANLTERNKRYAAEMSSVLQTPVRPRRLNNGEFLLKVGKHKSI